METYLTVPGYPCDERGTCFDAARRQEAMRVEIATALAARPAKKAKAGKKAIAVPDVPIEVVPEPELAFEQMELAL